MREQTLTKGLGGWERGYIPPIRPIRHNGDYAKFWRQNEIEFEPRQVIGRVKRVFEGVADEFNKPLSFVYNHFLLSGQLGSLPYTNVDFNLRRMKYVIGEFEYTGLSANGDKIRHPLVDHLFDTHKTKYVRTNICYFLRATQEVVRRVIERDEEKQQQ